MRKDIGWCVVLDYAKSKAKREEGGRGRKRGVGADEAPSTTPLSCSLAVWAEGRVNGKFSATCIGRCEELRLSGQSGATTEFVVFLPLATVLGMSASHTTPGPSTGLASGGVPTEASKTNQRIREFPDLNKTTRLALASEPAHFDGRLTVNPLRTSESIHQRHPRV